MAQTARRERRRSRSRGAAGGRGAGKEEPEAEASEEAPAPAPIPAPAARPAWAPAAGGALELSHLVYEVANLASASDVFERITGVRPVPGGRHEALGLQNAVVGLGGGRYLEFLAECPVEPGGDVRGHSGGVPVTVLGTKKGRPRLVTWCCDASRVGLSSLVSGLLEHPQKHLFPAEIALGTSLAAEGERITWRMAADRHRECRNGSLPMGGLVPFLVDWPGETRGRPGLLAPAGCELVELKGKHPEPEALTAALRAMRAGHLISVGGIERGAEPRLSAVIRHTSGQLVLE